MPIIYHITTKSEWEASRGSGQYTAASLNEEGFIHCSKAEQVADVLNRYFKDKQNLVQLTIDTDKLKSQLIYEWSPSIADTFPHIYGSINHEAVVEVTSIEH